MKYLILTILSAFIFQGLFWNEHFGANCLVIAPLVIALSFYRNRGAWNSRAVLATAAGTLFSAAMVVLFNSLWSKCIFVLSIWTFAGFAAEAHGKFPIYAIFTYFWNLSNIPVVLLQKSFRRSKPIAWNSRIMGLHYGYFLLPLIVTFAFFLIYLGANPDFEKTVEFITTHFIDAIDQVFQWLIPQLDFAWFFFYLFGFLMMGAILLGKTHFWFNLEGKYSLFLLRRRRKRLNWLSYGTALRREHYLSVTTLVLLNVLTGCVNMVDIVSVWFGRKADNVENLSQFVHTGTYWLIISILLAIGVLLFIYRANQNYYPKGKFLRAAAYTWVAQNAVMAISVGVRNYHYIAHHGLAYKRIGVAVFLLLTFIGLLTLYLKLSRQHTTFHMLRTNAWVWYASFVMLSAVNWDVAITRYNLTANIPELVDLNFLMEEVSDKNLFLLYEYRSRFEQVGYHSRHGYETEIISIDMAIAKKRAAFEKKMTNYSRWPSWNYPDYKNWSYLNSK